MSRFAPQALTLLFYVLINSIVLRNALLHDPWVGYDSPEHIRYIEVLSHGRFPTMEDSAQFFSAPLPYVIPAIVRAVSGSIQLAARSALLQNFIASLILTWALIQFAHTARPNEPYFPPLILAILGLLPVYYKSLAFVRGTSLVTMFTVLAMLEVVKFLNGKRDSGYVLGVVCAGMALARQWGVFSAAGLFGGLLLVCLTVRPDKSRCSKFFLQSTLLCGLLSGSFYFGHAMRHDDVRAFNRAPAASFSFANQPTKFYLGTGGGKLFSKPLRPSFSNQFFPVFYSEIWGDYWMYFNVYGFDTRTKNLRSPKTLTLKHGVEGWVETNRGDATRATARANLFGLPLITSFAIAAVASLLAIGLLIRCRFRNLEPTAHVSWYAVCGGIIFVSLLGYGWFLLSYPNHSKGDTIKATYMLHIFPPLAILTADIFLRLQKHFRLPMNVFVGYLTLAWFVIFPQFFSANTRTLCLREHGGELLEGLDAKGTCFFDPTPERLEPQLENSEAEPS